MKHDDELERLIGMCVAFLLFYLFILLLIKLFTI